VQNCKFKVNIMQVKWKSTVQIFSMVL